MSTRDNEEFRAIYAWYLEREPLPDFLKILNDPEFVRFAQNLCYEQFVAGFVLGKESSPSD